MISDNDPSSSEISVIIPNWNGCRHLNTCFQSLRQQTWQNFETILVDNASDDESVGFTASHFPEVVVIELDENRGFTGACIAGYEVANGRLIVLLNNDTECDPGWLEAIVAAFESNPAAGIVASKIMLFDDHRRFHAAGDFYREDGIPGNRGVWQTDVGQYNRQEAVFGACGAAAAYRRTMIEEIGFLDDRFYFSCEDIDLAWRANLAGWDVVYAPDALVYHKLKASGGSGATSSYYDGRNFLYVLWKNYPTSLLRRNWQSIVKAQMSITAGALRAWRGEAARARLRGQIAGLAGIVSLLPARKVIQGKRTLDDDTLTSRLTPVDVP